LTEPEHNQGQERPSADAVTPAERAAVLGESPAGKSAHTVTILAAGLTITTPLALLAVALASNSVSSSIIAALAALVLLYILAARLHMPWAIETALAIAALGALNAAIRPDQLRTIPRFAPYLELVLLTVFALGAGGLIFALYRRRTEDDPAPRFGGAVGLTALVAAFFTGFIHLLTTNARLTPSPLDPVFPGPALMVAAAIILLGGFSFLRAKEPGRRPAVKAFAATLISLAAATALAALVLADQARGAMLMSLALLFLASGLAGIYYRGRGRFVFCLIASLAVPAWLACWAGGRETMVGPSVLAALSENSGAAVGLAIGALLVYIFGLFALPATEPDQPAAQPDKPAALSAPGHASVLLRNRWNRSAPLVAGLAVGAFSFFALAALGGEVNLPLPGRLVNVDALDLLVFMSALLMATAWRVRWEPTVYLAAMGLLVSTGIYFLRSAGGDPGRTFQHMTCVVALVSAGLSLAGAAVALWRRRWWPAAFYSDGLIVTGLVGAAATVLLAAAGFGQTSLNDESIFLLAALILSLLVAALVFRQEDLFAFFGLAVLGFVLALFHVHHDPSHPASWLYRYPTVALGAGLVLGLAAWILAAVGRRWESSARNFGAALYASSFVAGAIALVAVSSTRNFYYQAGDLLGFAAILLLLLPHVKHAFIHYAVIAAVTAAAYLAAVGRWGNTDIHVAETVILLTAGLAAFWMLTAIVLSRLLGAWGGLGDKEARHQARPFTAIALTLAVVLAGYLGWLTFLGYRAAWGAAENPNELFPVGQVSPSAICLAWGGILLTFFLSLWVVRHRARTVGFYLVGTSATIGLGLLLHHSSRQLTNYLVYAVGGYGAIHLLVYLWEGPYMALLSRCCRLYRDEKHASTTIFTMSCISCFAGGILAAFFLHTHAALVMLWILTAVFFIWSFGHRRPEMVYPLVLMSVGAFLSVWHNIEPPENWPHWDATRANINACVFAAAALLWLGIGTALNQLRGSLSTLNTAARQMSVVLALAGLGFYIVLAQAPLHPEPEWGPDASPERWLLGTVCGLALVAYYVWAAVSFRRTFYVYLAQLSLAVLIVFASLREQADWYSLSDQQYWPTSLSLLALVMLGIAKLLERRRDVLFGRPILVVAMLVLPLLLAGDSIYRLIIGQQLLPITTLAIAALVVFLGARYRLAPKWPGRGE
jgi:hypothetical protein